MASVYVHSGAAGAGTGADWANAFTTLAAAFTAGGAGDTFYVADDHAETVATGMTLTSPGTAAAPCRVLCVRRSGGSVPPVSADLRTTATVTTTAGSTGISYAGFCYSYGVSYLITTAAASQNFNATAPWYWRIEAGRLSISTNANSRMNFGTLGTNSDDQLLELVNTVLEFGNAGQGAVVRCPFRWLATSSAIAGTGPTTLFLTPSAGNAGPAVLRGVDLSALGSGNSLVDVAPANLNSYHFDGCKLGSSVSVSTGSVAGQGGVNVTLVNCDSADTNYRYHRVSYQGEISQETTIVRTGGASDGVTPFSRKFVSSANSKFFSPLRGPWFRFWNETVGSPVVVAVETVTDNVTLTDAECWLEVEYPGTSGFPLMLSANDRSADILATPANQTTSSETWTTTGLTTPVKQTLSVSVTPQEVGWIRARVVLAKASTTVYACPKILAGATQYMDPETGDIVNVVEGGGVSGSLFSSPIIRGVA